MDMPPARAGAPLAWALALACFCALALQAWTGAAPTPEPREPPAATTHRLERLYFGRAKPCGGEVTPAQWRGFVERTVTPLFPDGMTVWSAEGQWRDGRGRIQREPTFVLELLLAGERPADAAIRTVVAAYRNEFCQQSVLWVRDRVTLGS